MAANNFSNEGVSNGSFGSSPEKPTKTIRVDRESTVFPARQSHRHNINLSLLDLFMMKFHYDQKGLFYEMPAHRLSSAIELLDKSLSQVLVNFYPLAGRLSTSEGVVSIDCNDAGAAFIEASAENVDIADLTMAEVTPTVHQLFLLNGAFNVEGHRIPLLAVQVTKLRDGMFVACSVNHCAVDGTSLWHFLNSWAEICSGAQRISVNPIHDHSLFSSEQAPVWLNLDPDADVKRFSPPPTRVKMFHINKGTIEFLKDRTNSPLPISSAVSSLQALCGHVWKAITRARQLERQDPTMFIHTMDCRRRLVPPLPSCSFGNFILMTVGTPTTSWELERNQRPYAAKLLQTTIRSHEDTGVLRATIEEWEKRRTKVTLESAPPNVVVLGSSPRFKIYETDFGWGKPVAVRGGCGNKFDGRIDAYPGKEGDGSIDLEICLAPNTMNALEIDQEFLDPEYMEAWGCF